MLQATPEISQQSPFIQFCWAFLSHLLEIAIGGAPMAVRPGIAWFKKSSRRLSEKTQEKLNRFLTDGWVKRVALAWLIFWVMYINYQIFRDTTAANLQLTAKVRELSEPRFSLEFLQMATGEIKNTNPDFETTSRTAVHIIAKLKNAGTAAAVDAASWDLQILTRDGNHYTGKAETIGKDYICLGLPPTQYYRKFAREDGLPFKAAKGVSTLGYEDGVLTFTTDLPLRLLDDKDTVFVLSAADILGRKFSNRISHDEIFKLEGYKFAPGLRYPYPVTREECPSVTW